VPVKLLTKMSESTADTHRLSFAVEWVFAILPEMEEGFSNPGLFDK
jgi:hypothetical protein